MIELIAAASFAFPGGSLPDLAKYASTAAPGPIVLMDDGREKVRAAQFDFDSPEQFRQSMRSYFLFAVTDNGADGWGGNQYSVAQVSGAMTMPDGGGLQVKDGKVTSEGTVWLSANSTIQALGGTPVTHAMVSASRVVVAAQDAPVADVLRGVYAAIGVDPNAKPDAVATPGGVIARVFKTRLIGGYTAWSKAKEEGRVPAPPRPMRPGPVRPPSATAAPAGKPDAGILEPERLQLAATAMATVADKTLVDTFAARGAAPLVIKGAPGSALHSQAWNLVQAAYRRDPKLFSQIDQKSLQQISPKFPVELVITPYRVPGLYLYGGPDLRVEF